MAQTAVPISTISNAWTLIPDTGEEAHEDIDEGVDTSDDGTTQVFNQSVFGGAILTCEVLLAALTPTDDITAPPVDTGHFLRLRLFQTGAGIMFPAPYVEVRQGASTVIFTTPPIQKEEVNTSWTTLSYPISAALISLISDYADLRVRLVGGQQFSPTLATRFRCSAVELRFPDRRSTAHPRAGHAKPGGAASHWLGPA